MGDADRMSIGGISLQTNGGWKSFRKEFRFELLLLLLRLHVLVFCDY